jgi:radical SAM superfamily enzyme YgiQ (UPF0313 family)
MKKVLLIMASHFKEDGGVHRVDRYWTSALTLPYLEALAPPGFIFQLVDDMANEPPLDTDADLVGLSAMGLQIGRAYWLADEYRRRGKTVVMGGEWVSLAPDQALEHCDAIVKGEAEYAWPELLEDFRAGGLRKRVYATEKLHDWKGLPLVDYSHLPTWRSDLMGERIYREYYFQFPLLVTRGCPYRCDYCCVAEFHKSSFRCRPIGDIIEDIRRIKAMGSSTILFMDDNPVGNKRYAKELFKAMIPEKIRWCSQCTINIAEDAELLELAARSGCFLLSIGFESIKQSNLAEINKDWAHADHYSRLMKEIRRKGIQIIALMMVGLDGDRLEDFDRTLEFLIRNKVSMAKFHLPMPYPGTRFYDEMDRQGRILTKDWNQYHYGRAVIRPKNFTPEQAEEKFWATYHQFFELRSIVRRFVPPPRRRLGTTMHYLAANLAFRHLQRRGRHPYLF